MASLTTTNSPEGSTFLNNLEGLFFDVARQKLVDVETHQDDNNIPGHEDVNKGNADNVNQDMYGGIFNMKSPAGMATTVLTVVGLGFLVKKLLG